MDDRCVGEHLEQHRCGDDRLRALLDPARLARCASKRVEQGLDERAARRNAVVRSGGEVSQRRVQLLARHEALEADSRPHPPPPAWELLDQLVAVEAALDVADQAGGDGVKGELAWNQVIEAAAGDQVCDRVGAAPGRPADEDRSARFACVNHGREP